VTLFVSEMGDL